VKPAKNCTVKLSTDKKFLIIIYHKKDSVITKYLNLKEIQGVIFGALSGTF
jgi:hypothetical protein